MKNQDRLSSLHDNLLVTIISFLRFKEAVKTSILSRRWRFIPRATRNMEFLESDFVKPPHDSEEIRQNKRRAFVEFIMGWIGNYQDSSADKFLLKFSHPENHRLQMQQILTFAINLQVKAIDVDFANPTWNQDNIEDEHTFLQLPIVNNNNNRRSNIESLRLFSCNLPEVLERSHDFSSLKSVSLGWITLTRVSIQNFLRKCVALENLILEKCYYNDSFVVHGPRLETLVLDKSYPHGPCIVNAPNLRILKYSGIVNEIIFDSKRIEEAELDFGLEREYEDWGDFLYRFLEHISSVKTLTLCTYTLQALPNGEEPIVSKPFLGCVKHLILKASLVDRSEFYGISFLLNSCPNLQILTFDLNVPARIFPEYEAPFNIEQHAFLLRGPYQLIYTSVEKRLKSVVMRGFKGETNELVVLRYLLKYARNLESLHIHISKKTARDGSSLEATYIEKVQKIPKFDIASQKLRIFLHRK
ncbi:hypothetical protein ACH5RR_027913 [Cinchona calisaya]|uniref:F-box domain-containing protein n=1 Tax=Cinchona calisaya TaxID=153742 RepID=A0ABD2YM99_9GENT